MGRAEMQRVVRERSGEERQGAKRRRICKWLRIQSHLDGLIAKRSQCVLQLQQQRSRGMARGRRTKICFSRRVASGV